MDEAKQLSHVRQWRRTTSFGYLALCAVLSGISVAALVSVGRYGDLDLGGTLGNLRPALTQVLAAVLGLAGALVLSSLDWRRLAETWWLHIVIWGLVVLTFFVGYAPAGTDSQSWLPMPLGMSFQPTEIAKLSFLLTFSSHLARVRDTLNRPRTLGPVLLHLAAPVVLIHFQGDDGTAMVFLFCALAMLVAAGLNRWVVAGCAAAVAATAPFIWSRLLGDYQRSRILGLLDPAGYADGVMYQQLQAKGAIEAGGLWGTGLFSPGHTYVPRAENDFIFSYIAEACGFVGAVVVLGLLFGLMLKTLCSAAAAPGRAGAMLCVGVFAILFFQTAVNCGMNLLLLPVIGVTLPFVSAGGTSTLTLYLAIGLAMSVERSRKRAVPGLGRPLFFD